MPSRPQRTLLPGLGVACAVLAGVLVAFSFAANFVGVELPLGESPSGPAGALQIEARRDAAENARRSARAARVDSVRLVAAATTGAADTPAARSTTATVRGDAPALTVETDPQPEHVARLPPPPPPARAAGTPTGDGGAATASAQTRPRNPLEPLGTGVNDTTDGVANTLRTLTDDLGDGVAPLSPELGGVLTNTGDALGDIVEGTGNLLGQVLGRPAGSR